MVDRYAPLDIRDFADGHYTDNQNGVLTRNMVVGLAKSGEFGEDE